MININKTIKKTIISFSYFHTGVLIFFTLFFILSCTSSKTSNSQKAPSTGAKPALVPSNGRFLIYEPFDYEMNEKKSFLWTPIVLPLSEGAEISESDLFLGYETDKNMFEAAPRPGHCHKLFNHSGNFENKKAKKIHFVSIPNSTSTHQQLFFILNPESSLPSAIVRLDSTGQADCMLPNAASYKVSVGFGSQRHDFWVSSKGNNSEISFPENAQVAIIPNSKNNILEGDLIRIGKSFADHNNFQNQNMDFMSSLSPKLESDLYSNGNFQSQDIGVDEFIKTSFLVGNHSYFITLDKGKYTFAILRKNKLVCLKNVDISSKEITALTCPEENTKSYMQAELYDQNVSSYLVDSAFYKSKLSDNADFQNWLFLNSNTFPRLYSSINEFVQSSVIENEPTEDLKNVFVPFSVFSKISSSNISEKDFLSKSDVLVSNGAQIKLFDYSFANEQNFSKVFGQKLRARIFVPAWNSTNVVEMYVDRKLYARWILARGDISKPYATNLEKSNFSDTNFTIQFKAWGSASLPNFFTESDMKPFAITRVYCVKVKANEDCDQR